jgi:hypothetical protein
VNGDPITCIMPTLGRPHLVEQSIRMFELQSYRNRELLIFDTGNQMPACEGDRWRIIPLETLPHSHGTVVNEMVRQARSELIVRWDDDDQYFPWHLEACVEALSRRPWAVASLTWDQWSPSEMVIMKTAHWADLRDACYAAAWSFDREAWKTVGGYSTDTETELEGEFRDRLYRTFGPPADTVSERFPVPSYCYTRSRSGEIHDSEQTPEQRIARRNIVYPKWEKVTPRWPDNFMLGFPMNPIVSERRW